ncbi:restriction endonuclease subunit S [Jhaorihella thermophila]|nr:restriction endonuclease subunit S [Jhaorihella thermophila]
MSVSKARKHANPIEVPYLRVANVQRGHLDLSVLKTMKIERSQLAQLRLRENDVLFNEGGDRDKLGRGWIWPGAPKVCITQNHVFRASPHRPSEAWSKFISYWGNSAGQAYFEEFGKQTTNLASINKTVLSRFPVPLPSLAEVEEIVRILEERLSRADALGSEIDAALARAEALRQAILKRAFSGRLVPQDPADEPATTLLARLRARAAAAPQKTRRKTHAS